MGYSIRGEMLVVGSIMIVVQVIWHLQSFPTISQFLSCTVHAGVEPRYIAVLLYFLYGRTSMCMYIHTCKSLLLPLHRHLTLD